MNDHDKQTVTFMGVVAIIMFFVGIYIGYGQINQQALTDCAKKHNVHDCEIQYVPVKEAQKND